MPILDPVELQKSLVAELTGKARKHFQRQKWSYGR